MSTPVAPTIINRSQWADRTQGDPARRSPRDTPDQGREGGEVRSSGDPGGAVVGSESVRPRVSRTPV